MAKHNALGKEGEQRAVHFLSRRGYHILEQNYRFQKAEIDIIAQKGKVVIAVEVKTRSSNFFGNPQDFVKPDQIQRLVKALDYYIYTRDLEVEARFDIIAIIKAPSGFKIKHLKDAFFYF